jgi:hypothetical protein
MFEFAEAVQALLDADPQDNVEERAAVVKLLEEYRQSGRRCGTCGEAIVDREYMGQVETSQFRLLPCGHTEVDEPVMES